ncbi:MAG: hypothetical protein QOF15_4595 [Mycobacterium sp.]|nr:hypothetical protein [Mycobacterium sp.]
MSAATTRGAYLDLVAHITEEVHLDDLMTSELVDLALYWCPRTLASSPGVSTAADTPTCETFFGSSKTARPQHSNKAALHGADARWQHYPTHPAIEGDIGTWTCGLYLEADPSWSVVADRPIGGGLAPNLRSVVQGELRLHRVGT